MREYKCPKCDQLVVTVNATPALSYIQKQQAVINAADELAMRFGFLRWEDVSDMKKLQAYRDAKAELHNG